MLPYHNFSLRTIQNSRHLKRNDSVASWGSADRCRSLVSSLFLSAFYAHFSVPLYSFNLPRWMSYKVPREQFTLFTWDLFLGCFVAWFVPIMARNKDSLSLLANQKKVSAKKRFVEIPCNLLVSIFNPKSTPDLHGFIQYCHRIAPFALLLAVRILCSFSQRWIALLWYV